MIEIAIDKKYFLTSGMMILFLLIISVIAVSAGGKGHVHKAGGTIKIPEEYKRVHRGCILLPSLQQSHVQRLLLHILLKPWTRVCEQ